MFGPRIQLAMYFVMIKKKTKNGAKGEIKLKKTIALPHGQKAYSIMMNAAK